MKRSIIAVSMASILLFLSSSSTGSAAAEASSVIGMYDGHEMEIAAGLELKADHHFHYALSYGALDEEAVGTWKISGNEVLLTSEPVVPAQFVLVSQGQGREGKLKIDLDVPSGMSRQYFDALITNTNDETMRKQLSDDGLISQIDTTKPARVRMLLSIFDVVSEPVKLDSNSGYSLRFRFEPHDLGKVAFQSTPLKIVGEELLLDRHGRTIKFKRSGS